MVHIEQNVGEAVYHKDTENIEDTCRISLNRIPDVCAPALAALSAGRIGDEPY